MQSLLLAGEPGDGLSDPAACLSIAAVLEEVGRADVGIGVLLANTLAVQSAFAVEPHRDAARIAARAPLFAGPEAAVVSLVLPDYGTGSVGGTGARLDGLTCAVAAARTADGWTLSGACVRPQCAGIDAAAFGVVAEVEGAPGLFWVPGDAEGLRRGEVFPKTGLAASRNADLSFSGVTVADEARIFADAARFRALQGRYGAWMAAVCSGAMLAGYEIVRDWSENRVIKGRGQVFRDNLLAASVLGEIGGKIATARWLLFGLARMLSRPEKYGDPGSPRLHAMAGAVVQTVGRHAMDVLDRAMELMASAGYATEWNLERYWRDVKTVRTLLGPGAVARAAMARHAFGSEGV